MGGGGGGWVGADPSQSHGYEYSGILSSRRCFAPSAGAVPGAKAGSLHMHTPISLYLQKALTSVAVDYYLTRKFKGRC